MFGETGADFALGRGWETINMAAECEALRRPYLLQYFCITSHFFIHTKPLHFAVYVIIAFMVFSSYSKFQKYSGAGKAKKTGPSKTETFKKTLAKIAKEKAEKDGAGALGASPTDGAYVSGVKLELNDETLIALNSMESTSTNIFLTGKAGTGKTTLVKYFKENTKKKVVILAPTGVSAVNIGGQTIHSFFKFGINITPVSIKKATGSTAIYKNLDAIIIDEISMVRADLLDCVDRFMRLNGKDKNLPFGGVQIIAVGDLFQLPPVVTSYEEEMFTSYYKSPYFFDSKVFPDAYFKLIELNKIYRQDDDKFIDILEGVRSGNIRDSHLDLLNKRHQNPADENLDPSIYNDTVVYIVFFMILVNQEQADSLKGALDIGTLKELIDMYGSFAQDILKEISQQTKILHSRKMQEL